MKMIDKRAMMKEADLRELLRCWVNPGLTWIEPARGSSVGQPDALIPVKNQRLPVELKWWSSTKRGLRCEVRPSQRHFHYREARSGRRTAFLAGTGDRASFEVFAFPGHAVPLSDYPLKPLVLSPVYFSHEPIYFAKLRMSFLFESEEFWESNEYSTLDCRIHIGRE